MSIANLGGGNVIVNDLKVRNIDTPLNGQSLTIGTVNANPVVIGQAGRAVQVKGRLETNIIDVDTSVGTTLFIGPDNAVDISIGGPVGNPVTIPQGILARSVNRGGSVGAGQLELGTTAPTTSLVIGQPLAPINLQASTLFFPSTGIPFSINDSRANIIVGGSFSGALVTANAVLMAYYRFGDWVTVQIRNMAGLSPALNSVDPIIIAGALASGYRPTNTQFFSVRVYSNGVGTRDDAQAQILSNGNITFGAFDTNHFTATNDIGLLFGYTFTFNINL
jgi:hypothetical protein